MSDVLWVEVVFGRDVEEFFVSEIGCYIVGCCEYEIVEVQE